MRKLVVEPSARSRTDAFRRETESVIARAAGLPFPDLVQVGAEWDRIVDSFVALVVNDGWTRKEIYELVGAAIELGDGRLGDRALDLLMDYESGMLGDCAPSCIPRFPGEPPDIDEHARWARSGSWLRG